MQSHIHASQDFFRRKRLNTNAMMESDPVDVPNVRPPDKTCALYKPPMAASDAMVASAVSTTDNHSQKIHIPDFFLDDLNIVRKGKRMELYAALRQVNNFIQVKRVDGTLNARSKIQDARCKQVSRNKI